MHALRDVEARLVKAHNLPPIAANTRHGARARAVWVATHGAALSRGLASKYPPTAVGSIDGYASFAEGVLVSPIEMQVASECFSVSVNNLQARWPYASVLALCPTHHPH